MVTVTTNTNKMSIEVNTSSTSMFIQGNYVISFLQRIQIIICGKQSPSLSFLGSHEPTHSYYCHHSQMIHIFITVKEKQEIVTFIYFNGFYVAWKSPGIVFKIEYSLIKIYLLKPGSKAQNVSTKNCFVALDRLRWNKIGWLNETFSHHNSLWLKPLFRWVS